MQAFGADILFQGLFRCGSTSVCGEALSHMHGFLPHAAFVCLGFTRRGVWLAPVTRDFIVSFYHESQRTTLSIPVSSLKTTRSSMLFVFETRRPCDGAAKRSRCSTKRASPGAPNCLNRPLRSPDLPTRWGSGPKERTSAQYVRV